MTYSVSTAGPYFTSGEIRFSALRDTFKGSGTEIRASELKRITTLTKEHTYPNVPDATENSNIATSSNWATSQFRNSIKYYNITQSGTNTDVSVDGLSWNGNLNKTIRKILFITGTIGATTSAYAMTLGSDAYNLTMNVSGALYGTGGSGGSGGGGAPQSCSGASGGSGGSGTAGGNALTISSAGRVIVNVASTGIIYAGGGGGGGGSGGNSGSNGTCSYYTYYYTGYACGSSPGCGSDSSQGSQSGGPCNCVTSGKGKKASTICYNSLYRTYCRKTTYYTVCGGGGGSGGSGGSGRGYNNFSGSLSGSGGSSGQSSFCPSPSVGYAAGGVGGTGGTGGSGASGGDWGLSGGGSGGGAGSAIRGSDFTVIGSTSTENIKGTYS